MSWLRGVYLAVREKERGMGPPVILCAGLFCGEEKQFGGGEVRGGGVVSSASE